MAVCKFWQQGNCRFGDKCRFEHPGANRPHPDQQNRNTNRFGSLNNNSPGHGGGGGGSGGGRGTPPPRRDNRQQPYGLDFEVIRTDLSTERPIWILSSFGPGRNAPAQLFGGHPREQSFEEMRLRHYELAAANRLQDALDEAQGLYASAEGQVKVALHDINAAMRYIIDSERQHPNRIDICKALNDGVAQVPGRNETLSQPPGQGSTPAFGQPSQPGAPSNPFAAAAASVPPGPVQPAAAAAGSNPTGSLFGQPSAPANPFGAPSAPSNPFAAAAAANPFGQAASSTASNPFAQAREQASAPSAPSGFGSTSQAAPGFGNSGFGAPAAAPSGFGAPAAAPSGFGAPAAAPSGFGAPAAAPSGFGAQAAAPSGFGAPAAAPSGFGTSGFGSSQPPPQPSGFQSAAMNGTAPTGGAPGGFAGGMSSGFGAPASNQPPQRDGSGKLTSWKGQRVSYIDGDPCFRRRDGEWERIWFPDGNPNAGKAEDVPPDLYDSTMEEQYRFLMENKTFKDGVLPELPPKREWTSWDF